MEIISWLAGNNHIHDELSSKKPLGERLAESGLDFPWLLLKEGESKKIDNQIRGTASVTSGGVILSPWQCLPEERVSELLNHINKLRSVTSGLYNL